MVYLLVDLPVLSPIDDGQGSGSREEREEEEGDILGTQTGTSMDLSHVLEGSLTHLINTLPINPYPISMPTYTLWKVI